MITSNFKQNIISFDIFDTLIFRLVNEPHQVFTLMELYAKNNNVFIPENFKEIRIHAEEEVNKVDGYYNIYDIYRRIDEFKSEESRKTAINIEIQAELDLCVPNSEMINVFNKCRDMGKHVVITSDMYLPREILEQLLEKCEIRGYKNLFVSCDRMADKRGGNLFRLILKEMNIKAQQLVHIGDNKKSDYIRPKIMGIHSVLYRAKKHRTLYSNKSINNPEYLNQQKFINCMIGSSSDGRYSGVPYRIGYQGMGPLLFGFVKWLDNCFNKDNIEKVFFLSRDGKIIERAYEAIGGKVNHQYFYASRKALIVPIIWKYPNLEDAMKLFFTSKGDTAGSIIEKLGLNANKYKDVLRLYNLVIDEHVDIDNINDSKFSAFYEQIKQDVIDNSKRQFELLKEYMKLSGFHGKIAIVDIGWFGNMQRAITEVISLCEINAEIHGYYLGIDPNSKTVKEKSLNVKGYLFEKGRGQLRRYEKSINSFVEYIFSATHGSVLCYQRDINNRTIVEPVFDQYEYSAQYKESHFTMTKEISGVDNGQALEDEYEKLLIIQDAAIKYIKDLKSHTFFEQQYFSYECCFNNMSEMGMHPNKVDLNFIGNIRVVCGDMKMHYIAKPQSFIFYFMHIEKIKYDLRYTGWRIGFIKRFLKLPLPYAEIYFKIREINHKED